MGPTKAIIKDHGLYEVKSGKVIKEKFSSLREIQEYATHHYIALPVTDKVGKAWSFEGQCIASTESNTKPQATSQYMWPPARIAEE